MTRCGRVGCGFQHLLHVFHIFGHPQLVVAHDDVVLVHAESVFLLRAAEFFFQSGCHGVGMRQQACHEKVVSVAENIDILAVDGRKHFQNVFRVAARTACALVEQRLHGFAGFPFVAFEFAPGALKDGFGVETADESRVGGDGVENFVVAAARACS